MALPDSVKSSVTQDNLLGGMPFPVKRGSVTVAASQTLTRGAVLGLSTIEAGTIVVGGSNTGDGVASAFALSTTGSAKLGDYVATCVTAVTNSGIFDVVDPDGLLIGRVTVAVSSNTTFTGGGITFNIADGATDFVVGDVFTFPVDALSATVATLLDATATDGSQNFYAILAEDVTTGAAETKSAPVYLSGSFLSQGLTFGGSTTVADVLADARALGCYLVTSYALENLQVY